MCEVCQPKDPRMRYYGLCECGRHNGLLIAELAGEMSWPPFGLSKYSDEDYKTLHERRMAYAPDREDFKVSYGYYPKEYAPDA